jgi:hypothetical protein
MPTMGLQQGSAVGEMGFLSQVTSQQTEAQHVSFASFPEVPRCPRQVRLEATNGPSQSCS